MKRAVIISGFVGVADEMLGFVRLRLLANRIGKFEQKLDPVYGAVDNRSYLSKTTDRLLWIHSTDDPMVNYMHNAAQVKALNNPNVRVITAERKKHNPQYTEEAVETMNRWIGDYERLVREKKLVTTQQKKEYFADKPVLSMTAQDPAVFEEIIRFIS